MAGKCNECGAMLKSVEEMKEHALVTSHSHFDQLPHGFNLICSICRQPCRSQRMRDLHTKRTRHKEFIEKNFMAVKPINPRVHSVVASGEMVVPEVDKKLLKELEGMRLSTARATRALHCSGNSSLENAVKWISEHENDPDIDQMPMVSVGNKNDPSKHSLTEEEKTLKLLEISSKDTSLLQGGIQKEDLDAAACREAEASLFMNLDELKPEKKCGKNSKKDVPKTRKQGRKGTKLTC